MSRLGRDRSLVGLITILVAASLVVMVAYFQPHKLFVSERRDEGLPISTAS